jgi:hypothetical protein
VRHSSGTSSSGGCGGGCGCGQQQQEELDIIEKMLFGGVVSTVAVSKRSSYAGITPIQGYS